MIQETRETKMRAWSPFNKEMYYSNNPDYRFEIYDGYICYVPVHYSDELTHFVTNDPSDSPYFIQINFWTGLKDKNNKDIYEGDIVKQRYYPCGADKDVIEYYYEGIIVWGYKEFGFQIKIEGTTVLDESKKYSWHQTQRKVYRHSTEGADWVDNNASFNRLEIIGNIYENENLLHGK